MRRQTGPGEWIYHMMLLKQCFNIENDNVREKVTSDNIQCSTKRGVIWWLWGNGDSYPGR